jgi:hypothetical protein
MSLSTPVFENSCGAKILEVTDPVDFCKIWKNLAKFVKIQPNHV